MLEFQLCLLPHLTLMAIQLQSPAMRELHRLQDLLMQFISVSKDFQVLQVFMHEGMLLRVAFKLPST